MRNAGLIGRGNGAPARGCGRGRGPGRALAAFGAAAVAAAAAAAASGCRPSRPGPETAASAAAAADAPHFQADAAAVTALAYAPPFLWVGSQRGLRRIRLPEREAEWIGDEAGLTGRQVSALAADGAGGVWVATETGVGKLAAPVSRDQGPFRYRAVALLNSVTDLEPGTTSEDVWAGTSGGLFLVEGGRATPIKGAGSGAVTSLDPDDGDTLAGAQPPGGAGGAGVGRSVWVGVRGRGLLRVDARAGVRASFGPPEGIDLTEPLGTARLRNGTRFAVGRSGGGQTRLLLIQSGGPVLLEAQPDLSVIALIDAPGGPALVSAAAGSAGAAGATRLHKVIPVERGEVVRGGGIRFSPVRKTLEGMRVAAPVDERSVPPGISAFTVGGGELYLGTRMHGVARLPEDGRAAEYLPVGELVLDARALAVACVERDRCLLTTANGRGWVWDGRQLGPLPVPGELGGDLMAVGGDGSAAVHLVLAARDGKTISVARLPGGGATAGPWEPVHRFEVKGEGKAVPTSLTPSLSGDLWIAVRDRLATGQELGRGVIELQLPSKKVLHHRGYAAGEQRSTETLPITGDVAAVRFGGTSAAPAVWLCTSTGVIRFAGGAIGRWGEDQGLESERCTDLVLDGPAVWIGGAAGPTRFDGQWWRTDGARGWPTNAEGEPLAARALGDCGLAGLRAGTARGVWSLGNVEPSKRVFDRSSGLHDDDVQDLACDRFGRLWVLGRLGVTLRDSESPPGSSR